MTTTYDRYLDAVRGDEMPKGQIQQMYNHVYPLAWWGQCWAVGGKRTTLTTGEAYDIVAALEGRTDGGPFVTEQQCKQGADWLERYGERLVDDGYPAELVGKRPDRFRFPRCEHFDAGEYGFFLPVYTAIYDDGTEMDYVAGAWQSQRMRFERIAYRQGANV